MPTAKRPSSKRKTPKRRTARKAAPARRRPVTPKKRTARRNPSTPTSALSLVRVPLDRGGYTRQGRYFGVGAPLYQYDDGDECDGYLRAADREAAKAKLRKQFPGVKFLR